MKVSAIISLLVVTVLTSGCDNPNLNQNPKKVAAPKPRSAKQPLHRFVLTRLGVDIAFDTQTGQLCKTWEWQITNTLKPDAISGMQPQAKPGEFAPLCLSLYNQSPSGLDDGAAPSADVEGGTEAPDKQ